ncbi:hypothetical protein CIL05_04880 [Virgibacillus profundi]|uniref:Uncharacterized protein n=1 Tax=Virgibacillus profundi TaxID=2024555 RepID=A0A2A2IH70_9BACI|nr:hypothetical protein [Virgibacillus profundi]PAV30443.1 hypothetical protein CIL05_04880 [Virgibacillus profundi]PXY54615.1 hypothetical protein CIT14_04965 [Virgibacillus profundi]
MKAIFSSFAIILSIAFVSFGFANVSYAAESNDKVVNISETDRDWLNGLGFSNEEINIMSDVSFNHIKEQFKGEKGEIVTKKEEYYKINKKETVKLSKQEALSGIKLAKQLNKYNLLSGGYDTETDSWIKQTLSVSYIGNGKYLAKTRYEWLYQPAATFSDAIAITHDDNVDVDNNSFFSEHRSGSGYEFDYGADRSNYYGLGDKFDLKRSIPATGFMYYEFKRDKTSDNTADLYGHYTHATSPGGFNISLSLGVLSLSGVTETQATDTAVDVTY